MKKNSLRFIAGLSAAAMFAMPMANAVAAPLAIFAADPTGSITVKNLDEKTTYNVYQILKSDLRFVDEHAQTATLEALKAAGVDTSALPADAASAEYANAVVKLLNDMDSATKVTFANELAKRIPDGGTHTLNPAGIITKAEDTLEVPYGYYILVDMNAQKETPRTGSTDAILITVSEEHKQAEVFSKATSGAPKVDKTVDPSLAEWTTITIGEEPAEVMKVPYKIDVTFPNNIADYESYSITIKDKLPEGVKVTGPEYNVWDTKVVATDQTGKSIQLGIPEPVISEEGNVISWSYDNILADLTAKGGWKLEELTGVTVTLSYTLVLTADEIPDKFTEPKTEIDPITNTVTITYPSDPFPGSSGGSEGEGVTSETPEDPSYLYVYNLNLKKVDDKNNELSGAEFTLTRNDKGGAHVVATTKGSEFKFTGLVAGDYVLTETTVPEGHRAIDPIHFTIKETEKDEDGIVQKITVTENHPNATITNTGTTESTEEKDKTTLVSTTTNIEMTVINNTGPNLPLTGEAGMTVGLIVGGLIIAVSGYAVLKNKKEENA
ncbi:SpaA isopeptide-forming pilin-related protein [Faecalibaculum rodentium]|uniref:SpaA isopeptide-forming pilin-related protein n=1 Tax=Faecalibaculum rodentium TaxID=1702221 RepID=UPI0025A61BB1|nr:SpaA isopeptide-forming pilin-related protein [Faecalibaculum rodentium]